jgi:kynureninase
VRRADGKRLSSRLGDAGVVTDFREPDSIRLGLSPLTTSFADVRRGIERLAEIAAA